MNHNYSSVFHIRVANICFAVDHHKPKKPASSSPGAVNATLPSSSSSSSNPSHQTGIEADDDEVPDYWPSDAGRLSYFISIVCSFNIVIPPFQYITNNHQSPPSHHN
jgi:hypothetical protein